jgi:hypothetical protein
MPTPQPESQALDDPHARLEKAFIEEYLRERGYSLRELHKLPEERARQLMTEATIYASSKLTRQEARAHFVDQMHGASPPL